MPWKARAGVLVLRAGELTATIDSGQFTVTLARNGQTLLGPPRDAHFQRRFRLPRFAHGAQGWVVAIDLAEGEPVYGHGEKWSRLDHRGQRLVSWNEDALGVNAEIAYKNCPFAWSPRGWGLFANTPARVVHGVGYAPWSHRSYVLQVEDEALDLFLIAAADPAGVLERYTWLTGRPARVPRWSLGAWLSKAYYRDADELLAAARRVRELRLPMDVITLDGRAWQDTATRFSFAWDKARYPDPRRVIEAVKSQGLRLCVWEYPLVSIDSPIFPELARRGFFLKHARTGEPWLHALEPGAVRAGADAAAGERARGLHQPRCLRLVGCGARGAVRCRRRRHQDRFRRAGAGRSGLHRGQRRSWPAPAQCLSAPLQSLRL